MHAALENVDHGILMLCPNNRVLLQNRRARELLGLSPDELRDGQPFDELRWLQFQPRASGPPIALPRRRIVRRDSEWRPLQRHAAEPDQVFLEVRSVPLADGGAVKTFTDVTEQWLAVLANQESEQRYRLLAENTTDVLILGDLAGARRYVSPATRAMFGCEPEELVGEHPLVRIHPEDAVSYERVLDDLRNLRVEQCVTCWRYRRFDGAWMWMEVSFNVVRDNGGRASGWVAVLRDVSSRRATEEALRLSEQRLALALDSGNDGLWDWCVRSGRVTFSQNWFGMLGYAEGEFESHIRTWERLIHPEDTKGALRCLTRHMEGQTPHFECEYRLRTKARGYLWTLARGKVVEHDGNGRPLRMVGTHIDITRRKEIEQQVAHIAAHDALTNLPNRALFRDRLRCELANAKRHGGSFAVLACDLDRFKAVNDTLGHPAGDALLRTIADRLRAIVRDGETVARLGGDEFAIILGRSTDPQAASLAAQRVIEAVGQPVDLDGTVASVGVSIGLAIGPQDGSDADTLFKNADIALYRAKAAGRNSYSFYEPGMDAVVATRIQLERDLRDAARGGEFVLHYQPILNLASGEVGGFEALLRW
ncbi:diguanylate cyclase (GGDEF)-like protein/PAS domain S-box-containing protein [Methylobacterium brachiatum]|uniref:Diguanylate cyclase (GGDEF)-like protein/PAS domain S-box-containing protein n=1 Tax=Methylobacterium brachiatum TaxID=269660 RepID=A0AAJ1TZM1_9HYPH|nr:diguanylate cyclase [Methylobacterium brachiatum]MCB4806182.1 diguanylate cyclase [Methylobacterium brachiatum]MDQ0546638.1 diguanylate cyclase (GGDEF)-like protein/PAS domain S-box-containing protein [Methylobacterium brachiatum]